MRLLLTSLSFSIVCFASAQNWALLNPAYRYNYSNDGTDTISNQIRVMHIDTLGVDSFRYELNLIGVVCDTCPATLGGPCDGCFVRVNQPQFLGYDCVRSGTDWTFKGVDTFLLKSNAAVSSMWTFNATTAVTATVDDVWPEEIYGVTDTLSRILLSSGDSILLSRSFGILRFTNSGQWHFLLGVEGAGVGQLYPDVLNYFDYQVGDELVYMEGAVYSVTFPGGPNGIPYPLSRFWKVFITGRSEIPDGVLYSTSVASTSAGQGVGGSVSGPYESCSWPRPLSQWVFTRSQILAQHPILAAYPGQVLDTAVCWLNPGWHDYDTRVIAQSSIAANGMMIMRTRDVSILNALAPQITTAAFDGEDAVGPDLYPPLPIKVNQIYEEGLGLRTVEYNEWTNYIVELQLKGAIIGGDTIIPPPAINWTVGVEEHHVTESVVIPNPASDFILLSSSIPRTLCTITDLQGRIMIQHRFTSTGERIDVQALPPGMYLLQTEKSRPQRFMVAR